jgi:ankyrin repeat protein
MYYFGLPKRNHEFIIAAAAGDLARVKLLLKLDVTIDAIDNEGCTALMRAAQGGHLAVVKLLFKHNAATHNTVDNTGRNALMFAAKAGHVEVVHLLLDNAGVVDAVDNTNFTALMFAAEAGHFAVVNLLLERGAAIAAINHAGCTALMIAANSRMLAVVSLFIEFGESIEAVSNVNYADLLLSAAGAGHVKVVRLLLDSGVNINAANISGNTALICAVKAGHVAMVSLLIDHGAAVNIKTDDGDMVALNIAAKNGNYALVQLLLQRGARTTIVDREGQCPLIYAVSSGHIAIVQLLLDSGANIAAEDKLGKTALMHAANSGHVELIKLLLDRGADIQHKDDQGRVVIMYVLHNPPRKRLKLVNVFLEYGATLAHKDYKKESLLQKAAFANDYNLVYLLLNKGAECDFYCHDDNIIVEIRRLLQLSWQAAALVNLQPVNLSAFAVDDVAKIAIFYEALIMRQGFNGQVAEHKKTIQRSNISTHSKNRLSSFLDSGLESNINYRCSLIFSDEYKRFICSVSASPIHALQPLDITIKRHNFKNSDLQHILQFYNHYGVTIGSDIAIWQRLLTEGRIDKDLAAQFTADEIAIFAQILGWSCSQICQKLVETASQNFIEMCTKYRCMINDYTKIILLSYSSEIYTKLYDNKRPIDILEQCFVHKDIFAELAVAWAYEANLEMLRQHLLAFIIRHNGGRTLKAANNLQKLPLSRELRSLVTSIVTQAKKSLLTSIPAEIVTRFHQAL